MDGEVKKVKTLFGSSAEEHQLIGYCHYHKAGITREQMRKKDCLNKQCGALQKLNPKYWEKREMKKIAKKAWQKIRKERYERRTKLNQVSLVGRLTNDPKITYGGASNTAICKFNLAVNREGKDRNGNDRGADFINCVAFGKTAELMDKYCAKGQMLGVTGSISTGSYEKDGRKVYTTEVAVARVEFLSKAEKKADENKSPFEGFSHADDVDIPFE